MVILAAPYALFDMSGLLDEDGKQISPWYFMLSEAHGGWSLARVQLFIWFVPAVTIYVALSIRQGGFATMDDQMTILLGLGGATSFFSTAVTPPPDQVKSTTATVAAQPTPVAAPGAPPDIAPVPVAAAAMAPAVAPAAPAVRRTNPTFTADRATLAIADVPRTASTPIRRPNLRDLVTDFDNHGDMSRYQYLVLCIIGAGLLVIQAIKTGAMPDLPPEFLYLVGASQTAYLGTKAVKRVAIGNASESAQGSGQA